MEHCEREGAQERVCGRTGAPVHGQGARVLEGEGDSLAQSLHIQSHRVPPGICEFSVSLLIIFFHNMYEIYLNKYLVLNYIWHPFI